ncbi:DNA repair protein endonuclease SAE2/CtIP C-terminus-domain-containing protein [Staphylotrichum tortipilum]|uniref:DNA repair protein endonuclease SAE2/CtIP C-terminus-domain-containing protein n=1 Tax=Staphylotrichum tortipilum TaxID=2831512 RepID=A0AAN6MRA7_9PEZI|nr:DNA repair protein endonuclease SAE2/CtIP C-terminus-domain-containing protein [Staphylotrichum longicolle]
MEYWPRKGRPMLLAALEAVCDTVEDELAAECQRQRDASEREISQLKATASRVAQLEQQNRALLQELDQLRTERPPTFAHLPQSSVGEGPLPTARPPLADMSTNAKIGGLGTQEKPDWEKEYTKLSLRYTALQEREEERQRRARQYRESRDSWMKYAQSLETKNQKLEKRLERHGSADEPLSFTSSARPRPARVGPPGDNASGTIALGRSIASDTEPATHSKPAKDGTHVPAGDDAAAAPAHSEQHPDEDTQNESEGADELPSLPPRMITEAPVTIKQEPSSNPPVIISERTIRKRKHAEEGSETSVAARKIKSEPSTSSDPIITGEAATFCPHESIDLDGEERGMPTPRKQRALENQGLREESNAIPVAEDFLGGLGFDGPRLDTRRHRDDPRLPVASTLTTPGIPGAQKNGRSPVRAGWTLGSGIADVAEETAESFYSPTPKKAGTGATAQTPIPGRLQSLLNQSSPEKKTPFLPSVRASRQGMKRGVGDKDAEDTPPGHTGRSHKHLSRTLSPANGPLTASPRRRSPAKAPVRLRDRPMAELRPEDFKVNPKSNNGYKHAFDEVVRNREERAELAGCTDPNCCGKDFRAMAESELSAGGPGVLLRIADTKMMEEYMGSEAYRLVDMTREERQDTWLKAKIQDLADRYGRHRHRYARRPSPPGYWDPDFPTTQEIEQNKEEAEKLERAMVEERWRAAMRGAGRWLFRDE